MRPRGNSPKGRRPLKPSRSSPRPHRGQENQALIVVAKAPIPGQVKTRLCPPLSGDEAASLHGSMVMDILERCRTLRTFDRFLACTPSQEHAFFKTMAARFGVTLWDQVGTDLGQRMNHALTKAFQMGYQKALLVGTDIPTLAAHTCTHAIQTLADHDVVFGPTADGGYYLVGMKRPMPELFHGIPWSTSQVLSKSLEQARGMGLSVGQLETQHDLDTILDIQNIIPNLRGPNKSRYSTRTANVLGALAQRHLGGGKPN